MSDLKKPIVWPEIPCEGESRVENWPSLYCDLAETRVARWTNLATMYEAAPNNFYAAWWWLNCHPIFWYFGPKKRHESTLTWERGIDDGLEFRPAMVAPLTLRIEDDKSLNTLVQMWVEVFPSSLGDDGRDGRLHDSVCDTGGDTYEAAVIEVAKEIYKHHGNDRVVLTEKWKSA